MSKRLPFSKPLVSIFAFGDYIVALEKCPFCNSTPFRCFKSDGALIDDYYIHCDNCGANGPNGSSQKEAIEYWNRWPQIVEAQKQKLTDKG